MRQQELLDEEDRTRKIPDISSSSTALAQGEVGYNTVAGIFIFLVSCGIYLMSCNLSSFSF